MIIVIILMADSSKTWIWEGKLSVLACSLLTVEFDS